MPDVAFKTVHSSVAISNGLHSSSGSFPPGKLGDRPRDYASNLHNIRLPFVNNATFRNGYFGDMTLVFGARGVRLGLRVCATT